MTCRSLVRSRVTGLLAICFFNAEKAEDVFKFQHKKKKEKCSRQGWMEFGPIWSSARCPRPWQGTETR